MAKVKGIHFFCGDCRKQFHKEVWHCPDCNAHWELRKRRCPNCRYSRITGEHGDAAFYAGREWRLAQAETNQQQKEEEYMPSKAIILGELARLKDSRGSDVCITLITYPETGMTYVDFRVHVDLSDQENGYVGPTKRGFRIPLSDVDDLHLAITNVKEAVDSMKVEV